MTKGKIVTMKKGTELVLLEPTEVPQPILDIFRRKKLVPNFYGKMGEMYCFHTDGDDCGIAFFFMVGDTVYIPAPGQPQLIGLAIKIADFVHGIEE